MLQALRDKTSGPIALVILGVLILAFSLVGIEQYLVQRTSTTVATIDAPPRWWTSAPAWWPASLLWDRGEVTIEQYRSSYEAARQQQRTEQGEAFDPRAFESLETKRAILDTLIDQEVQRLAAEQAGVVVSDVLVRRTIQEIPAFQVDGKFDPERYQLALASQVPAQTPTQFEQNVRSSLQQTLVPIAVARSHFVTSAELDRLIRLLGERRDVSLMMLPPPDPDTAAVSAEEITTWYGSHKQAYREPETVAIEYVEVDASALRAPAAADEATLRERFEQDQTRFTEQEQRLASHILVEVDEKADAATQQAAEREAAELAAKARAAGADFAALAGTSSDDTGSKATGGDLGWIGKGMMPAAFEAALFALQPGEVSAPVKTEFGWHVIQLREVKSGQQESFEDVRDSLAREQAEADRERAFNELSGTLMDAVLENPGSLAPAADAVDLPVQKLGPFARDANVGIAANPAVRRAAFSEALIQDGTVSDPIELAPNHNVWIRVVAHTPERVRPLAQVRDQVIAAIRADRARAAADKRADALLARLKAGESMEAVAAAESLPPPQTLSGVQRGMPLPVASVSEAVFAAQPSAEGQAAIGKSVMDDGRVVLFAVTQVTPGDVQQIDPQQRETLQQQVVQIGGTEAAQELVSTLRKRMRIEVTESNL